MRSVGIGVIGCGEIAKGAHFPALSRIKQANVVAAIDVLEERAKKAAKEFGVPKYYTGVDKALKDPEIEAVMILLPHFLHTDVALKAMEAGKHIFIEKPLSISLEQANRIVEAKKKTSVKLMVAMMMRFNPINLKAKELIEAGKIGKPIIINDLSLSKMPKIHPSWWHKKKLCGGFTLPVKGIHLIDRVQWLGNSLAESVYAEFNFSNPDFEGETECVIILRLKNQILAQISAAKPGPCILPTEFPFRTSTLTILGSDSSIRITSDSFREGFSSRLELGGKEVIIPKFDGITPYEEEIREFVQAIIDDREPLITAEDGRNGVRVMEAIKKTVRTKKVQKITYDL